MGQVPSASGDVALSASSGTSISAGRLANSKANESSRRDSHPLPFRKFLIVGGGRTARHFAEYFRLEGLPASQWRRSEASAQAALSDRDLEALEEAAEGASHVVLAISDRAIEPVLTAAKAVISEKAVVHLSGALETALAPSAHPLMTFGERTYSREEYQQIWFAIEEGRGELAELLPGLPNPAFRLKPGQKAAYHAWCALSGNLTAFLWSAFFERLETEFGAPREAALPYLRRQALNLELDGARALTGPLARGDRETVAKHFAALQDDSFLPIYQGFAATFAREAPRKDSSLKGGER